jgi:PKD repeat protein
MAEATTEQVATKQGFAAWIKPIITSLAGALSGAVLMYASPLVDMIIKPAKPIANFQSQADGLMVTLQNKSTGGHEGWWDFGDGSALEPFVPEQAAVTHAFAKADSYQIKLSLKNLVGDESDRTVTVVVAEGGSSLPSINTFDVVPVAGDCAPATFRLVTEVKNASLCVWAVNSRALEFSPDTANGHQERFVAFKEPGTHIVKLAAYNGKQQVEKTATVVVKKAPAGFMTATVAVTYEAVLVEQKNTSPYVQLRFPADQKSDVATVSEAIAADMGFTITKADLAQPLKNANIKSAKVQIDPAKPDQVLLTCELVRPSARQAPPPYHVHLALTQQRFSPPVVKTLDPISVNLTVPGSTTVPLPSLPPGWIAKSRKMTLTLQQDAKEFTWNDNELPRNAAVQMSSSAEYIVNAAADGGQLQIDVTEIQKAKSIIGD